MREILKQFDPNSLVIALMGASPEINSLCERLFPDIDLELTRSSIGRVRIETVEEMQNQIISMANLQAIEFQYSRQSSESMNDKIVRLIENDMQDMKNS